MVVEGYKRENGIALSFLCKLWLPSRAQRHTTQLHFKSKKPITLDFIRRFLSYRARRLCGPMPFLCTLRPVLVVFLPYFHFFFFFSFFTLAGYRMAIPDLQGWGHDGQWRSVRLSSHIFDCVCIGAWAQCVRTGSSSLLCDWGRTHSSHTNLLCKQLLHTFTYVFFAL